MRSREWERGAVREEGGDSRESRVPGPQSRRGLTEKGPRSRGGLEEACEW